MDMYQITKNMFKPILDWFWYFFKIGWIIVFALIFAIIVSFLFSCRLNFFKIRKTGLKEYLKQLTISIKYYDLMKWVWIDLLSRNDNLDFDLYGFTIFCGRQGSGKTISMVKYLIDMKEKFPECIIVTNFNCSVSNFRMKSWRDFFDIRNGEKGVIFAIDEIHSEYSSASWKDFPETLLSEISQQRKQKVKIVATSQVFSRVAKPIREQAFSVIQCNTYLNRSTCYKEYDAAEYGTSSESSYNVRKTISPLRKKRFVQTDKLRESYDTYEKIKQMEKVEFIPRNER